MIAAEAVRNEMNNFLSRSSTPVGKLRSVPVEEDKLARESDVTVSTNTTLYAEYKGFFIYVSSAAALLFFIGWTLLPDTALLAMGISYYPNKYWSQAIPVYFLMLMLFAYVFVALYNTEVKTLKLNSLNNFLDCHTVYPEAPEAYIWRAPSGVWDLPVGLVNDVLYDKEYVKRALADFEDSEKFELSNQALRIDVLVEDTDMLEVWDELLNGSSLSQLSQLNRSFT